jgi:hypothetical protein
MLDYNNALVSLSLCACVNDHHFLHSQDLFFFCVCFSYLSVIYVPLNRLDSDECLCVRLHVRLLGFGEKDGRAVEGAPV